MTETETNWKRMCFKTNKVWVQTDPDGRLILKEGKVLIKYQKNQTQEYRVPEASLKQENHPDCMAGHKSPKKEPAGTSLKGTAETVKNEKSQISDDAIIVYTDGACSGNPGPSGIGVVLAYKKQQKEISRYIGVATNNIAELEAIRTSLMAIKNRDIPVRLHTDSSYAIGVLSLGWKAKANQDLIMTIKALLNEFKNIRLIKVEGHAGVPANERADFLATSAIAKKG